MSAKAHGYPDIQKKKKAKDLKDMKETKRRKRRRTRTYPNSHNQTHARKAHDDRALQPPLAVLQRQLHAEDALLLEVADELYR